MVHEESSRSGASLIPYSLMISLGGGSWAVTIHCYCISKHRAKEVLWNHCMLARLTVRREVDVYYIGTLESMPTPCLKSHLSLSPMAIFSTDYGIAFLHEMINVILECRHEPYVTYCHIMTYIYLSWRP